MTAPEGWYPDPEHAGHERYWDGDAWSDARRRTILPPSPPIEPPAPGWWQAPDGGWHPPTEPRSSDRPVEGGSGHSATTTRPAGTARTRVALAAGAVVVAVVVAVVLTSDGDHGITIRGEFTLTDEEGFSGSTASCTGDRGYSDFGPGMNVVVRDGEGTIVGTSDTRRLDEDHYEYAIEHGVFPLIGALGASDDEDDQLDVEEMADLYDGLGCTVVFTVEADQADFYAIEVGRRGELTYTDEELAEADYYVAFSLGD